MDICTKKQHLHRYTFYLINVCLFIVLSNYAAQAQVDSLKTDSVHLKVVDKPLLIDSAKTPVHEDTIIASDTSTFLLKKRRVPAKATLYSMILPGLGQAYNGKYWKIPIIYTLFGTMYYFIADNDQKYKDFKYAYKNFENEDLKPGWVNESISDAKYLKERMDFYKRNRDLNIILGGLIYLLNILDANVDAHLMDFDVSEDLALRIEPDIINYQAVQKKSNVSGFGIKFVLSLNR